MKVGQSFNLSNNAFSFWRVICVAANKGKQNKLEEVNISLSERDLRLFAHNITDPNTNGNFDIQVCVSYINDKIVSMKFEMYDQETLFKSEFTKCKGFTEVDFNNISSAIDHFCKKKGTKKIKFKGQPE